MTPVGRKHVTRIGKRNQVTIPAAMLRKLGLAPGEQVEITVDEDRQLAVKKAEDPFERLRQFRESLGLPAASNEQLVETVHEARREHAVAAARKHQRTMSERDERGR